VNDSIVERRPVSFAVGTLGFIIALTVVSQVVLEALFPRLTGDGVALVRMTSRKPPLRTAMIAITTHTPTGYSNTFSLIDSISTPNKLPMR
jgi:hypothetical protein